MAENSTIEWTDHTVNFWWGCAKVSPACAHCYAEALDKRYLGWPRKQDEPRVNTLHWGTDASRLLRVEAARREALRYERQAVKEGRRFRVFTNSMADFFEDRRDLDGARLEALEVIRQTPHLDWLILTKRPEKIRELLQRAYDCTGDPELYRWLGEWINGNPPANVWLGTTVEDQERADQRIPHLLKVPAAVRFLSCEPLLGPLALRPVDDFSDNGHGRRWLGGPSCNAASSPGIDWVICGGESGPHARPMHPDWARGLRDQCAAAGVPFLFKQWGEWAPFVNEAHYTHGGAERHAHTWIERDGTQGSCWIVDDDGSWSNWTGEPTEDAAVMGRHGKKAAGRLLDGVEHNGYPEVR